ANGKLILGSKHHFLSQGAEAVAAGELKIVNGLIKLITNKSGHFSPTVEDSARAPGIMCYGPNYRRTFGRIVTVEISA
ncbi:MAG: hypothetical protein J0M26_29240, partial [Planctomycetes bacterium]|nr:hypothetical protein [Planctomycetota bacterium]